MTVEIKIKLQKKRKLHIILEQPLFQIYSSKRNENFHEGSPWNLGLKRFCFGSLTLLMTSRAPFFTNKREHCHCLSFDPIYLKFEIWAVFFITRFGIVSQLSTSEKTLVCYKGDVKPCIIKQTKIPHQFWVKMEVE